MAGQRTPTMRPDGEGSSRGRLQHVEINVSDLERSVVWWSYLLGRLGYRPYQEWDDGISFRLGPTYVAFVQAPAGAPGIDRWTTGLNHLAFTAASAAEVDELTADLEQRGERILYSERHPYAGGPNHYALFLEDPDGLKVEIVAPDHPG